MVPPKGGAALVIKDPVWLTAVSLSDDESKRSPYANEFPAAVQTEHLKVVNAGFWLANDKKLLTQVYYQFSMTVAKPFEGRVYTRVLMDNPADPAKPIQYEHHLDPKERSTEATHGPLASVKRGEKYTLRFEVFSDEARTKSLEQVVQAIIAPLDSTSGCVELRPEVMLAAFPKLAGQGAHRQGHAGLRSLG